MFILAHLSDPHLAPMQWPRPRDLISKRVHGFVNWHLRRRAIHRAEVLDALITDMKQASPDHIAVTGDLVNLALRTNSPCPRVARRLGDASRRDARARQSRRLCARRRHQPRGLWRDYMREADEDAADPKEPFPFVRRRGPLP